MAPEVQDATLDQEPDIPLSGEEGGTPQEPAADAPIHLARCAECGHAVRYKPMPSGFGFSLPDPPDDMYGVGANGRPICPQGHGEMSIADDQIQAHDAIAEAARLQDAQQAALPGIIPPFNYQGAYLELEEKALEVERLHGDYEDAAKEAREAKKDWERAAELLVKMTVEFRRRRREKVAAGEPVADVDPSRCTFEQLHPDTPCPICRAEDDSLRAGAAPANAAEHAQQADELILLRAIVAVEEALEDTLTFIDRETIRAWTDEQRAAVKAYAVANYEQTDPLPERPDVLGKNHVAGPERDGEDQACTQCDAVLAPADGETYYPPDSLVGIDCPGKPNDAHRYTPTRSEKAPGKKKAAKKGRK